ncbi:chemotaxis protein CheB [Dyadobacter sp. CY107]|uniref:chemotaxis protein CheB n=1 Tax=Dyadobacter fanqingshengii TaxID=2906443 RepID=UPI001F1C3C52|nr:chemotaxis protein CheB [Dyadobacter fanqingshengii]MCF2505169.1 chemotaxis protein CheB [Dyadobacter fanqingshengii]
MKDSKFFIVAIGFSSGGTDDLHDFFSQIPAQPNAAFIVIPHLGRDYISVHDKMLAKHTELPVTWATDHDRIEPNHIYILPVGKFMTVKRGHLELYDRDPSDKSNWAVNIFLDSMAKNIGDMGVGIILSGAGSDGALGAMHLHQQDGIIMVQDPATAEFTGMPESAIIQDSPFRYTST